MLHCWAPNPHLGGIGNGTLSVNSGRFEADEVSVSLGGIGKGTLSPRALLAMPRPNITSKAARICFCMQSYGPTKWRTARSQSALGEAFAVLGQASEAEPLLMDSYRTLRAELGEGDELTILARKRAASFLSSHGRAAEIDRLLAGSAR